MIIEEKAAFSRETEKMNMHISTISYAYLDRKWRCKSARAAFTRIYFVTEGRGEMHYAGKTVPLLPGHIYVVPCELDFSYNCEDSLEKLYCHVQLLCYNRRDLCEDIREIADFPDREEDIERALSYWRAGDVLSAMQLKELLYRVLCEAICQSGVKTEDVRTYSPLIKQAVTYIEKNLRADLTASEVAAALFVSDSRLQKNFRREMGISFGKYVSTRVLAVAEEQLRLSTRTISEISDALGYCDRFYFSRVFGTRYGASPARYRKNISP